MRLNKTEDRVIFYHNHIEKARESGVAVHEYCKLNGLKDSDFHSMRYRIEYKMKTDPEENQRLIDIINQAKSLNLSAQETSKQFNVTIKVVEKVKAHIRYQEIIAEYKKNTIPSSSGDLGFVRLSAPKMMPPPESKVETELLSPQNDIQISISQGIKVSISPNIDSHKIIKIIELLKDL